MASMDDILTTAQRVVQAINTVALSYLNVQGVSNAAAVTSATLIKPSGGRVASISVITAGSATGMVYDAANTSDTTRPLWVIPMTEGITFVNLPAQYGIVVAPGSGQSVTVSWS